MPVVLLTLQIAGGSVAEQCGLVKCAAERRVETWTQPDQADWWKADELGIDPRERADTVLESASFAKELLVLPFGFATFPVRHCRYYDDRIRAQRGAENRFYCRNETAARF